MGPALALELDSFRLSYHELCLRSLVPIARLITRSTLAAQTRCWLRCTSTGAFVLHRFDVHYCTTLALCRRDFQARNLAHGGLMIAYDMHKWADIYLFKLIHQNNSSLLVAFISSNVQLNALDVALCQIEK